MAKLLKTTCIEAVALRLCLQCALAWKITQTCILQTLLNKHFIEQNITFYTSTWRIKLSEYNGINIKFIHVVRLSDIDLWKHRILTIICIFYWFQLRAFSHYNVYICLCGGKACRCHKQHRSTVYNLPGSTDHLNYIYCHWQASVIFNVSLFAISIIPSHTFIPILPQTLTSACSYI